MNKIRTVCILFILMNKTGAAQNNLPAGILTLKQCVETGIANNLDVQQSGLQMQNSKINWNQVRLDMLPDLNGIAGTGINQGRSIDPFTNGYITQQVNYASYGLSSGVVLFNGLAMQNTVKQNALAYEASKMDWQQAKDNLTITIILAYLLILNNEDQLVQFRNQESLTKNQVERLEILNRNGAITPSDLSDIKGQYANDQLSIISAQTGLEISRISLCRLMNIPYNKNIQLERLTAENYAEKYPDTPDKIYEESLKQFSLIKAVDLRKQSAEKAVKAAKGRLFPTLSLNVSAATNYSSAARNAVFINTTDVTSSDYVMVNGTPSPVIYKQNNYNSEKIGYGSQLNNNFSTSFNLNLRIPIFNSLQQRNNIKLAQLSLKNNELIAATTKTELQQSIEQAYINMTSASERYKVLLEQVSAFKESFRAAEIRFNSGVGNSIDYLITKNSLDRANTNVIIAKYDYILRTKVLDYYQGKQLW